MDTQNSLAATLTPTIGPKQRELPWLTTLVLISVALHAGAVAFIGRGHTTNPRRTTTVQTEVTLSIEPAKPAGATKPAGDTKPAPKFSRTTRAIASNRTTPRRASAVAAAPQPAAREPEAETPADFTGVTLTKDGAGAGWASATGSGGPIDGPIGTPGARVTGRSVGGATGGVGRSSRSDGPPILALADLSKPPRAPVLSDMLERNYPDQARKRGMPGKAIMHLRVMPDGHLRDLIVVAETQGGFGEACKRTLRDSVWSPPLDLEARPVSTFVTYTCTFAVH